MKAQLSREAMRFDLAAAAADRLSVDPDDVAEALAGCHGVPSDAFWSAFDDEVDSLASRYQARDTESAGGQS